MIKAAIFDLGNVLVLFDHQQMINQLGKVCGISTEKVYEEVFQKQIGIQYELGNLETPEVYEYLRKISTTKPSDEELFLALGDIFTLNEPMVQVIESLKNQGVRLVILSNTCDAHLKFIRRNFSILDKFDAYVYSHEVRARKPDKIIFKKAVELAGCSAKECFYTDDILEYVEAAKEIGIDAEQFVGAEKLVEGLKLRALY